MELRLELAEFTRSLDTLVAKPDSSGLYSSAHVWQKSPQESGAL